MKFLSEALLTEIAPSFPSAQTCTSVADIAEKQGKGIPMLSLFLESEVGAVLFIN